MSNENLTFQQGEQSENKTKDENLSIFFGTEEVAKSLRCSIPTAREIMHRRDFPLIQVGKNMRVLKGAFEQWAMERRA